MILKERKIKVSRVFTRVLRINKANNQIWFSLPRRELKMLKEEKENPKRAKIKIQELRW